MSKIGFPGLGLEFNINPIAFTLFGKGIYWYGIIISFALFINIIWAMRDAPKFGINPDDIVDMILFTVPVAIIGARLYYVIFNWKDYVANFPDVFKIWNGGLAIYGAIITSIITVYIFAKVKKINVLKLFDFCSPFLVLGQAIGRWGNFVNREAYGAQTNLPWRMEIDSIDKLNRIAVHPTFLYESLWNLGVFIFLMWYRTKNKNTGRVFFLYMLLYGAGRFWIEGLRTDSLMLGSFRVSQILAAIMVVVFSIVLIITKRTDNICECPAENSGSITKLEDKN